MKIYKHLVLTALLSVASSLAWAAGNDELWDMSSSMVSGGRSMALPNMQSCMAKGQDHPTPPDKSCKVSGAVGKSAVVMECAGPPAYTMKFEGTRSATAMKGTMTLSSGGNVSMVQEFSAKLVGSCDVATFVSKEQSGMPGASMNMSSFDKMPSFDTSTRRAKQASTDAVAPEAEAPAAATATAPAAKAEPAPQTSPIDKASNTVDAVKKALGGLFR